MKIIATKLKQELEAVKNAFEKNGKNLDAMFVAVCYNPKKWREAKALGCKKDGYYGWILWSGSVNCDGNDFSHEVFNLVTNSKLSITTRCRQL